jgi:hypothetical protein
VAIEPNRTRSEEIVMTMSESGEVVTMRAYRVADYDNVAPPRSVMNWRRFMRFMRSPCELILEGRDRRRRGKDNTTPQARGVGYYFTSRSRGQPKSGATGLAVGQCRDFRFGSFASARLRRHVRSTPDSGPTV